MAKPEWGSRRVCLSCGSRFYDLLRDPIVCPDCGTELQAPPHQRGRRSRPAVGKSQPATAAPAASENLDIEEPLADDIANEVDLDEESEEAIADGGGNDVSDVI